MFYTLYWKFIKANWKLYILYFIFLLSVPLENTTVPHYYGELINVLKTGNFKKAKTLFLIILGVWSVIQLFSLFSSYLNTYLMPKFQSFIRQYFFNKIIDSYSQEYKELELGQIIAKIIRSPSIIQNIFVEVRDFVVKNSFIVIGNFIYLWRHHHMLGYVFAGMILLLYLVSFFYYRTCNSFITNTEQSYDNVHEEIQDTLTNLLSIYTCQQDKAEKDRVKDYNKRTSENQIKTGNCNNKFRIIYSILYVIIFIAMNYTAYYYYKKGEIKLNNIVAIFIINYSLFGHLSDFYYDTYAFMNVYTKVEHITKFIESLPIRLSEAKEEIPNPNKIDLVFKNIKFTHPNTEKSIYDNLNLHIPAGQSLAIMGSIGSGKSTIVKLLVRLQKHQEGDIIINETSVERINLNNLRKHIIYVPQHPVLFNRTLWENITYGLDGVKEEDIYKILDDAGLKDIKDVYKEKMHKPVGKLGTNLSGGQRQIVWLIRCILRESSVIILDEPTSALDEKSRRNVETIIKKLSVGRTLIIITHDRELLMHMDRVIYFDKGEIIQDEILKNKTKGRKN
jgi:ABC-type multidrug transport system fused ATPase/permease subunit